MAFNTDAILLLPALLCDSRLYKSVINHFAEGVEVLVADTQADDNLTDMAVRAIESMPSRFALVGNSMGGYLALEIAARAPECVTHLALIGTNAHADCEEARARREQAIRLAESGKFTTFVDGYAESALSAENHTLHSSLMREMARDMGAEVLVRQQRAIMNRNSHEAKLHEFSMPSLVTYGREDSLVEREHQQDMAKRLPNCRYVEVQGCGHLVPLEAPAFLNRVLRALFQV